MSKSDSCKQDSDCIDTEACFMAFCENPCNLPGTCAANAICQTKKHRPICSCPKKQGGNPAINCTTLELSKEINLWTQQLIN